MAPEAATDPHVAQDEPRVAHVDRHAVDPAEARRGVAANAPVPVRMDDEFARVLTKRIADRLAKQSARAQTNTEQPTETGADSSTGSP